MPSPYADLLPGFGERSVADALADYFDRKTLMGVLVGGHAGKIVEKVYALILIGMYGGSFWRTSALLGLWVFGLLVTMYLAVHWHIISDLVDDATG